VNNRDPLPQEWFAREKRYVAAAAFVLVAVVGLGTGTSGNAEPPRPERTAAERASAALQLREIYRGDPAAWPAPHVDPGVEWREIGILPPVVHPESNPLNDAKAKLGETLFFDNRLSASGHMACVSCHDPKLGWADGRALGLRDANPPRRNTPTILNTAFQTALFWDGRAASLEQQAEKTLANPNEMAGSRDGIVRLLAGSDGYRALFAAAFPGRPIEFAGVVEALACFERTIVGGRSRFDNFVRGDPAVLSEQEILGLDLFRRDARCMNCHHSPTFSDGRFHDLGLSFYGRNTEDGGRYAITGDAKDNGRFRTPTLRNVTQTAPYMHTGAFGLAGVLNMYNAGMPTIKQYGFQRTDPLFPTKSPHLKPLGLNRQDIADLSAFLGSLEEPTQHLWPPALPAIGDAAGEPRR
jgi:cytochrome c peroxidase